ncbi:MAG TPA: SDR family oxidoreductase [Chitinophagaceae bacterium]|nr:SDR family oxidoreductase [Chitinophagaceae bacterium]
MNSKVLLIPGGTSGIGRATALLAAERGWHVVAAGRDAAKGKALEGEAAGRGGSIHYRAADISDARSVEALVAETVRLHGRLDAACNSAALEEGIGVLLADVEEGDYDRQMGVNLKGAWLCLKYEIRQMLQQGGGSIVNVSSVNGLGGAKGAALYAAAKSGLLGLTKSAAQEYATSGIRINALCAGAFRTPMLEGVFRKAAPDDPASVEAVYNSYIPMARIGHPEEAAEAILWLLSDAASYVTGHSMIADGGFSSSFR